MKLKLNQTDSTTLLFSSGCEDNVKLLKERCTNGFINSMGVCWNNTDPNNTIPYGIYNVTEAEENTFSRHLATQDYLKLVLSPRPHNTLEIYIHKYRC